MPRCYRDESRVSLRHLPKLQMWCRVGRFDAIMATAVGPAGWRQYWLGWGTGAAVQLEDNEIHLWLTDLDRVGPELISAYWQLMSQQERERNLRYRSEAGRAADCTTRALARTVLSRYADVDPADWQFSRGRHGKPEIEAPAITLPLRFNLSHTRRYVVCGVGLRADLGIDIEQTTRSNDLLAIVDRFFSKREVDDLKALAEGEQRGRFFDYWTLKEAYMKASGEGIALGLGNFSFLFDGGGPISIEFSDKLQDRPDAWSFHLLSPVADHRLGVASRNGQGIRLRLFEGVPMAAAFSESVPPTLR